MGQPAVGNIQYFIGANGEQSGPFTESQILEQLAEGKIPEDALIWFEGLAEWQPLHSLGAFKKAMKKNSEETPPSEEPPGGLPSRGDTITSVSEITKNPIAKEAEKAQTHAPVSESAVTDSPVLRAGKAGEAVFKRDEALFTQSPFIRFRVQFILGGLVGGFVLFALIFYVLANQSNTMIDAMATKKKPAAQKPQREDELRKATSELLLNPSASLGTLSRLLQENPEDAVGKQALEALLEYQSVRSPHEAGRLLMQAKRPIEARTYYLQDPPEYQEAEKATFAAFEASTDPRQRKELLLEDIRLLLGVLSNQPLAVERIQLFEKTFPSEPHPYGYYLKAAEGKIQDLFNRLGFFFVESLLGFLRTELPQIHLTKRPLVELVREKDDSYRIVGTFQGDVLLNQDRLKNIYFTFWQAKDKWYVVETNLTLDRSHSSSVEKQKLQGATFRAAEMLTNLEQIFHREFPKNSLHETVSMKKVDRRSE